MSGLHLAAGSLAGGLAFASFAVYIHSILKGETRPNRATWLILPVSGIVLIAGSRVAGASWSALIWPSVCVVMQAAIFVLSLRYGEGGITRFDLCCLATAGVGILLWFLTNSPTSALVLTLMVDFAGITPTIRKAVLDPLSESRTSWGLDALAGLAELGSISVWSFYAAAFPLYAAASMILIAGLLYAPGLGRRWRIQSELA